MGELTHLDTVYSYGFDFETGCYDDRWENAPKWWPTPEPFHGLGMMFVGLGWVHVDGWYLTNQYHHYEEHWPEVRDNYLHNLPTWERLEWHFDQNGTCLICGKEMQNDRHSCTRCHELLYGFPCSQPVYENYY
jgi:hypothetical protein